MSQGKLSYCDLVGNSWWLCLIAWTTLVSSGAAQSAQPVSLAKQLWKGNVEIEQCAWCHYSAGNEFAQRPTDFCRLTEVQQWLSADKHAVARQRIEPMSTTPALEAAASNQLSLRIVQKLGYRIETDAGYALFRANCLTCHAGYDTATSRPLLTAQDSQHPGISCVYCHQDGANTLWLEQHGSPNAPQNWRGLSPAIKSQRGMRHLATAESQAVLCSQCHIGDIQRNMFVTHAMYVAGHPQLPSTEHNSFTTAIQPHWRPARELWTTLSAHPTEREAYFRSSLGAGSALDSQAERGSGLSWNTQAALIGAVVAEQQHVKLLKQSAQTNSSVRWGDYALYDCAGCHHNLRAISRGQPSYRQQHRASVPPGRPVLPQWPNVLLHSAFALHGAKPLDQTRQAFQAVLTDVPYGEASLIADAGREYTVALDDLVLALSQEGLQQGEAARTWNSLLKTPRGLLLDYESARQLAWSANAIAGDIPDASRSHEVRAALEGLALDPRNRKPQLQLILPGPQRVEIYPTATRQHQQLETNFDPKSFYEQVQALRAKR